MNSAIDVGIDKVILSLVINPDYYTEHGSKKIKRDDENQRGYFLYLLSGLNDSKKFKKNMYKEVGSTKKKYPTFTFTSNGKALGAIDIGTYCGNMFININFNPSKLTGDDWALFSEELLALFPPDHFDLLGRKASDILLTAVAKVEFYIDVYNTVPNDFVFFASKVHKFTPCENTLYMGRRSSNLGIKVYDKALQLAEKNKNKHNNNNQLPRTRVEFSYKEKLPIIEFLQKSEVTFYDCFLHWLQNRSSGIMFSEKCYSSLNSRNCKNGQKSLRGLLAASKSIFSRKIYENFANGLLASAQRALGATSKIVSSSNAEFVRCFSSSINVNFSK